MLNTHWLLNRLLENKTKQAIIWQDKQFTYENLYYIIEGWMNILREHNVLTGEIVAICADYSPNSCALLLALFINQNIILPITSATKENKQHYIQLAEVQHIITINERDEFTIQNTFIKPAHPLLFKLQSKNHSGLILFSSGSTGKSKAMVLDGNKLLTKFIKLNKSYRTLVFLLLDHIGGINTLLHTLTQGGTLITIDNRDPNSICKAIEAYQVELLPTTPTFLNMLLISEAHEQYDLSSLKLITYGTESMPISTLSKLNEIFINVSFKQTYGLSELGILPTKSESSHSSWFLLGNETVKYKVNNGILLVHTDTAMLGYLNAPPAFDNKGWFITGDIVETKQVGDKEYLRVLGREKELINVGGEKVYPNEVENVLLQIPNIVDAVVIGKKNPVMGQIVMATVRLKQPEELYQLYLRVKEFCRDKLEPYKIPLLIEVTQKNLYGDRYKKKRARLTSHVKE